jgi:hypothetical protein
MLSRTLLAAMAMQALRMSLNVPERMGWNGDPCAPTRWDPWEGVTCNLAVDKSGLIITNLYLLPSLFSIFALLLNLHPILHSSHD